MKKQKLSYLKKAKSIEEQILTLRKHGVSISNEDRTKQFLEHVGYFRIGFYLHFFESSYPRLCEGRSHMVIPGTRFEDVERLYEFDFSLRTILNKYLSIIEVSIRTAMINTLSCKYKDSPAWYMDPAIVTDSFISDFPTIAYSAIKKNDVIRRHHNKYKGDYAPAWKIMEYMTLGNLEILYSSLRLDKDKKLISNKFGEPATATFKSYLSAIREVRNACAHGKNILDLKLCNGIRTGMAGKWEGSSRHTLKPALLVIEYLLNFISPERCIRMKEEWKRCVAELYAHSPQLKPLVERIVGTT